MAENSLTGDDVLGLRKGRPAVERGDRVSQLGVRKQKMEPILLGLCFEDPGELERYLEVRAAKEAELRSRGKALEEVLDG